MRFIHLLTAAALLALLPAGCGPAHTSAPPAVASQPQPAPTPAPPAPPAPQSSLPPAVVRDPREAQKIRNDLEQIGLAYQDYLSTGNGPSRLEDLYPGLGGPQSPMSQGLASGKYKLYLNVNPTQLPAGTSNTVLGYFYGVPTDGGPVLMADGHLVNMTVAEFQAAPKAGR